MKILDFEFDVTETKPCDPERQVEFEEPAIEVTFTAKRGERTAFVKMFVVETSWNSTNKLQWGDSELTVQEQMKLRAAESFALLFVRTDMGIA